MQQKPARIRILDAAHELMLTIGLARATTKEIAKAAGCSEAALCNKYFPSKEELFVNVLKERLPQLSPLLAGLAAEPGRGSLLENLTGIARQAALFYEQSFPIAASLYAETGSTPARSRCAPWGRAPTCPSGVSTPISAPNGSAGQVPRRGRHLRGRLAPCWAPAPSAPSPMTPRRRASRRPWTSSPCRSPARCWAESPLRTNLVTVTLAR